MKLLTFNQHQKPEESKYLWYSPNFEDDSCFFYCLDLKNYIIKGFNRNELKKAVQFALFDTEFLFKYNSNQYDEKGLILIGEIILDPNGESEPSFNHFQNS